MDYWAEVCKFFDTEPVGTSAVWANTHRLRIGMAEPVDGSGSILEVTQSLCVEMQIEHGVSSKIRGAIYWWIEDNSFRATPIAVLDDPEDLQQLSDWGTMVMGVAGFTVYNDVKTVASRFNAWRKTNVKP